MVKRADILITVYDFSRLSDLLKVIDFHRMNGEHTSALHKELNRAHIFEQTAIPRDVVTMHSQVCVTDLDSGEKRELTVVFPIDADLEHGKISIVAPLGTALLGSRVGDTIEFSISGRSERLRIEEILYQPEASGNYYL